MPSRPRHVALLTFDDVQMLDVTGLAVVTAPLASVRPGAMDTVLVAGGSRRGRQALTQDAPAAAWLRRACARARRYGSVCTGAFVLTACGLLDGRRVATHWEATDVLGRNYPDVEVETLRLDHARTLLQTSLALKTVAAQTGYATPGQLSKAFARRFGISPGLFRAVQRGENAL